MARFVYSTSKHQLHDIKINIKYDRRIKKYKYIKY